MNLTWPELIGIVLAINGATMALGVFAIRMLLASTTTSQRDFFEQKFKQHESFTRKQAEEWRRVEKDLSNLREEVAKKLYSSRRLDKANLDHG